MALYHFSVKVIQRSAGRSAVAAAAYRSASELHDARQDHSYDYTAKCGVVHSDILLPTDAPARWQDRAALWNEVEAAERRKDAVLAREVEFALPRELSQAEGIALAQEFVRAAFVSRGMVADLNVHWPRDADGEAKPHAHVMLTMREVVPAVEGQEGREAARFGPKRRDWNDKALLCEWRERWAEVVNARLHELGHDARVDHRSHAAQGIALEPQNKIGPAGARRADRGEDAERAAEHRAIARRNGEALLADPGIALQALTHQHSTFTRRDLARFVDRHMDGAEQFASVVARVEASPELVRLGADGRGRERFSTREMLAAEERMERFGAVLAGRAEHGVTEAAALCAARVAERSRLSLGAEQAAALLHVTSGPDLALVVGFAGTGKSSMLGVARRAWEAAGLRVRGAALSGIAAEGLEAGSGIASRTLASLEYGWKEGRDELTSRDVLVVDEAGMIGSRQMERVLSSAAAVGAKVVLVGDPEQLQAIEAGAAFRALSERHGSRAITAVRRQREAWQREATRELATGRTGEALGRYQAAGMVRASGTREEARAALVAGWDAVRRARPAASQVMLAYTRDDVRGLNELARERMRAGGALVGADQVVATEWGERLLAVGDRIMFGRNERGLGAGPDGSGGVAVKNGSLGTVLAVDSQGERLTVQLDGPGGPGTPGGSGGPGSAGAGAAGGKDATPVVTFYVRDYGHVDHGYAATVHKAQGMTVDRAHVLATPHMDRHASYVALTRHRDGVELHYAAADFADSARLVRALSRERAKDTTLDYGAGDGGPDGADPDLVRRYGERRGLNPLRPESEIVVRWEAVPAPERMSPSRERTRAAVQRALGWHDAQRQARQEVVEPKPEPAAQERPGAGAPVSVPALDLAQILAAGRAGFRARFEAHKQQARARDEAAARALVATWDRVRERYAAALPEIEADPGLGGTREPFAQFGRQVREQPGAVLVLRERGEAFGMTERPNLLRIVSAPEPERVVAGIMAAAEDRMRVQLAAAREAEREAAREAARQREVQAPRPRHGPSMGM